MNEGPHATRMRNYCYRTNPLLYQDKQLSQKERARNEDKISSDLKGFNQNYMTGISENNFTPGVVDTNQDMIDIISSKRPSIQQMQSQKMKRNFVSNSNLRSEEDLDYYC